MLLNLLIVSRYLGSEVLGQLSLLVVNIAIIHAFAEIYSGSALVYFIPRLHLGRIYGTGLIWIFLSCLLVNVLMVLFKIGDQALALHVLFISYISAINAFHNVMILGRERTTAYNFMVFFQPACMVSVLFVNVFLLNYRSVYACILALYISHLVSFILSGLFVLRLFGQPEVSKDFRLLPVLRNGFVNQMGNLAHILSNRFNFYIIGMISIGMVGVYSSATSLIESVWIISISVSPLVLTHIANRNDIENNSRMTFLLAKLCFILSLICVLILYFIPADFFTKLLGKDFSAAKSLMLHLSPGVLCVSFSSIISHYFSGLGRQRILLIANASGLLVTLSTSYYLISEFGVIGACYAASLAYFVQALVLTVLFMTQNEMRFTSIFSLKNDLSLLRNKSTD
jgi:O-antigen/teichoic acid export membrane protein